MNELFTGMLGALCLIGLTSCSPDMEKNTVSVSPPPAMQQAQVGKNNHENMTEAEKVAELQKIPANDTLTQTEIDRLKYQYSEEKLAHDMYMYFYELYGQQTFVNIANSEIEHMQAVKRLLDMYRIPTPTDYGDLEDEYGALKKEGEKGLKEALEVGVKIEILDIDDIVKTLGMTDNEVIKKVFVNIGAASYNHLRGFVTALNMNNFSTEIDYSAYLSADMGNSTGPIKYLFLEKLEQDGVEIDESYLMQGAGGGNGGGGKGRGNGGRMGRR